MCQTAAMTNVEKIRKLRGLTQTQLADLVGTSQPHISRIERGDDGPPLKMFAEIATALNVPLADLFSDDRSIGETVLLETFRKLSPDRQRGWLDLARLALSEPAVADQETAKTDH